MQEFIGADTRSRTRDLLITNQLLYQLSYASSENHLDNARKKSLAMPYFHMENSTLSSAQNGFTTEFGMDQVVPERYSRQA